MELPALSLSESFLKPTTMLYRNMLAMDAEEMLRGHPVDGVGADGWLRQDDAGSVARRHQHGSAVDLSSGRADVAR